MNCHACRSNRLTPVFHMDPMPLAGAFAATEAEAVASPKYPLTWHLCADCGLVNVEPDIPDDVLYSTYSYAASTVPAVRRHHAVFASILSARYGRKARLLDIGSNDGVLLNQLPESWDLWGWDPSDIAAKASVGARWHLRNDSIADTLTYGHDDIFDVITASNSLAHFSDIAGALDNVAFMLKPGGEFWVEVHQLEATLLLGQWDTIYHEHKVEWSARALVSAFARHGLEYIGGSKPPLHGGLHRLVFRKGRRERIGPWLPDFGPLQATYDNRVPVKADAAYGAAGRASVYLNQCDTSIRYVVDASPVRAGKFMPGTGSPIVTPDAFDEPPRTLITAWDHAADIRASHPGYDGWLTAW